MKRQGLIAAAGLAAVNVFVFMRSNWRNGATRRRLEALLVQGETSQATTLRRVFSE
jgi:hypothetical protein